MLEKSEQATWIVSGNVNFEIISELRKAGDRLIVEAPEKILHFDFSKVNRCDSSGLALMLAWRRKAWQASKTLKFIQVPNALLQMAAVCGVQQWIN